MLKNFPECKKNLRAAVVVQKNSFRGRGFDSSCNPRAGLRTRDLFFKGCPGQGGKPGIFWFLFIFLSQLQRLRPLGYCAPPPPGDLFVLVFFLSQIQSVKPLGYCAPLYTREQIVWQMIVRRILRPWNSRQVRFWCRNEILLDAERGEAFYDA